MALLKTTTYKGIDAEYWKIIWSNEDYLRNLTMVKIALYLNKNTRDANTNNYLTTNIYSFEGSDLTRINQYDMLKLLGDFTNSIDA